MIVEAITGFLQEFCDRLGANFDTGGDLAGTHFLGILARILLCKAPLFQTPKTAVGSVTTIKLQVMSDTPIATRRNLESATITFALRGAVTVLTDNRKGRI